MIPDRLTPRAIADITRRRWRAMACSLALAVAVAGALAAVLPPAFKSEATVLVRRQEVAESYVKPTMVNYDIEDGLQAMVQQVMSRARLLAVAREFGLYPALRGRPPDLLVDRMRQDIAIEVGDKTESHEREHRSKGAVYFKLSFPYSDPVTAQAVASRLVSLFVEENERSRTRQARLATDLLDGELARLKSGLDAQERRINDYKQGHLAELPEQLQANLAAVSGLDIELQTKQAALSAARERELVIQRALADLGQAQYGKNPGSMIPPPTLFTGSPEARLAALRQSLPSLEARYKPTHPNILKVRSEIARLEAQVGRGQPSDAARPQQPSASGYEGDLGTQLGLVRQEEARFERDQARLLRQVDLYKQRVEATARHQVALTTLSRDYELAREDYQALLKKRSEAGMSERLESRQQGEIFEVVDPPSLPGQPVKPQKIKLLAIAVVLGLMCGMALALALENADRSFTRRDDLEEALGLNVLATIPLVKAGGHGRGVTGGT